MIRRNSFILSRALRNFLSASIMTSLAGQLATTTDAVIVSHMIGPDALSAINVVMPLTMLFSCASILIGLGASVLAARAIGQHDKERVNRIFTTALLLLAISGIAISLITCINCPAIVEALCDNARITPYATEYTEIIAGGALFLILSNGINYFVSTDGSPGLVTKGVLAGAIANIPLDIILVEQMGISGSAAATIVNYIITLTVVSTHFFKKSCSYSIINPFKGIGGYIARNIYEGLPLMLGNLLLGFAVFAINSMILSAAGADGIYIWTICLQLLMITFIVLNGVGNAMLSVGGVLAGEKDFRGVRIMTMLLTKLVCSTLALLVIAVLIFPEMLAAAFGAGNEEISGGIAAPLRIFSLLLIPFAVTLVMRFLFQILEYRILSLVLSAGQLAGIIACLWIFISVSPENLWWSFPVSAFILIVLQIASTAFLSRKKGGISPITLIPKESVEHATVSYSVANCRESIARMLDETRQFLHKHRVPQEKISGSTSCCSIALHHFAAEMKGKKEFMDVHIRIIGEEIHTVLRKAGQKTEPPRIDGAAAIEHKYMYGQNVLFIRS